jgi:uncharacterized membrane protein YsdA (DUF1294 family)/cold shock CspA family protein
MREPRRARPLDFAVNIHHHSIMRYQGRITTWNDDRGFGFIEPDGGGQRLFVHISAFPDRARRPTVGQTVTYELGADPEGRPRGVGVAFAGDRAQRTARAVAVNKAPAFAILFLAFVIGAGLAGKLPFGILGLYLGAGAAAFLAYFMDKAAAKKDMRRIPENTLHLLGLIGGWPGAMIAQRMFHHKTRKTSFQVIFWGTVVLNCVALAGLFATSGPRMLTSILSPR